MEKLNLDSKNFKKKFFMIGAALGFLVGFALITLFAYNFTVNLPDQKSSDQTKTNKENPLEKVAPKNPTNSDLLSAVHPPLTIEQQITTLRTKHNLLTNDWLDATVEIKRLNVIIDEILDKRARVSGDFWSHLPSIDEQKQIQELSEQYVLMMRKRVKLWRKKNKITHSQRKMRKQIYNLYDQLKLKSSKHKTANPKKRPSINLPTNQKSISNQHSERDRSGIGKIKSASEKPTNSNSLILADFISLVEQITDLRTKYNLLNKDWIDTRVKFKRLLKQANEIKKQIRNLYTQNLPDKTDSTITSDTQKQIEKLSKKLEKVREDKRKLIRTRKLITNFQRKMRKQIDSLRDQLKLKIAKLPQFEPKTANSDLLSAAPLNIEQQITDLLTKHSLLSKNWIDSKDELEFVRKQLFEVNAKGIDLVRNIAPQNFSTDEKKQMREWEEQSNKLRKRVAKLLDLTEYQIIKSQRKIREQIKSLRDQLKLKSSKHKTTNPKKRPSINLPTN